MPQKINILIVEDSPADAALLVRELGRAGYDPVWQRVDTEAEYLRHLHAGLDLVLSDYQMPQFNGLHALKLLKESGLEVPFIIVSGSIGEDTAVTAMKQGAADYLIKDRLARLGTAVGHALEQSRLRRERQEAEKARMLFRALVDRGNDAFEVVDPETGRFLDVNEKACTDHGYTWDEHLALTVFDVDPELTPATWPERVAAIRRDAPTSIESVHRRKDGTLYPVEISVRCVQLDREYMVAAVRDISERKRAESALKLFRTLVDQGNDTFEVVDPETGRFLDVNEKGCFDRGYTREEYLQLTVFDVNPSIPRELWPEIMRKRREIGAEQFQTVHRRKDGTTFPVEISARLVTLDREYMVSVVRDISERVRTEKALKLFRALVDQGGDTFEVVDPETGRFLDVNEKGCVDLGYTREEFLQLTVFDVDMHEPREEWPETIRSVREAGSKQKQTMRRRKDGTTFPVEIRIKWVQLDREYMVAVVTDITERKRAESALRESEEKFRQLAEKITEVFWIVSCDTGDILYVSPAYEAIWGRTCESLCRSPDSWSSAIHPDDRPRVEEAFKVVIETGKYDEIYRITRPDGSRRWIHDRGFPVANAEGRIYRIVGTAEDITKQRLLEEQFRQAQKMEAIGTLAGGIAHDFNNILAAINGYAELAKMQAAGNAPVLECLDTILKAGGRAVNLVRQILTFSRQQEVRRVPTQLAEAVAESVKLLRATIPTTIDFSVSLLADTPPVLADATQIHQIMMNLGTNAWHAMRERPGRLEVKLEKIEVDSLIAGTHPQLRMGSYVRLMVGDTGKGMDRATVERIFEPFFTTKGPGEGTGLGLAVVHGIMQEHEGAITVYSQPGEGTVFHLYFPAYGGTVSKEDVLPAQMISGLGKRILFVDDEEVLAVMGQKTLERLGYKVDAQTRVTEALALVRADPQRFDLVITDQTMPEMTGLDLATHLQEIRPDLPIILTSGYSANLTVERTRALGIREMLMKPHTIHALAMAVQRALA